MTTGDQQFRLPGRVDSYLATLNRSYERAGEALLREIVVNGFVSIHEAWDSDNWNGGSYGHAITLTLPEELYFEAMESKNDPMRRIAEDINKLDNTQNEYVSAVFLEMEPAEGDHWREQTGVYRRTVPAASVSSEAMWRIWGSGHVRVFLSHKSTVKQDASRVKESLARCGIDAFVAHEDIEPTLEWQREIERALFSMDAFVALLTKDYHDSRWTDQEVGVAIGRGVPMIAVRLGLDPYGLMGKGQGLGGCSLSDPTDMAIKVFTLLFRRLPDKSCLFQCALFAYAASTGWDESAWNIEHLLSIFERLTPDQLTCVVNAYRTNKRNRHSFKGIDLLKPLLEKWSGARWVVRSNELVREDEVDGESIPF